jgi:tetratricopeptide (TPR) repeat protein
MSTRLAAVLFACSALLALGGPARGAQPAEPAEAPALAEVERALDAGRVEDAVAFGRSLAAARPDDAGVQALLGRALALAHRFGEAAEVLERAVALGADDVRTLLYYGSALWEAGRPEAAEPVLARAATAAAGTGAELLARHQLGRLRLWSGRPEAAVEPLERAVALRPTAADARLDLARALERAGRAAEAVAAFEAVIALAPENHYARWGLAQALFAAGRPAEAEAALAAYRELLAANQERVRQGQIEEEARARLLLDERRLEDGGLTEGPTGSEDEGEGGVGPPGRPAAVGSSEGAASPACRLRDVAAAAGLDFVHDRGTSAGKHLAETMGAGLAWLDYDGDGWPDLYAVQSGPFPPDPARAGGPAGRLFRNLGPREEPPGRPGEPGRPAAFAFEDVTAAAGVGDRGYGMGAVAADADGDGDPDLLVTRYGGLAFYRNRGDGTFEEAAAAAGLALDGWSSSAAFADADGDSDLDLYVTRYVDYPADRDLVCGDPETGERRYCDPSMFEGAHDRYFENLGNGPGGVTFEDATVRAGLEGADGRGLGVLFTDLDGDGAPDLYVANDLTPNFLFRNRGRQLEDGSGAGAVFEDLSLLSGAAVNADGKPEAGMGLVAADFDGDGDPDLAVTNFDVETNTLYENQGGMLLADRSAASGFGPPSFNLLGFGLVAADLDGDGDLDAYAANGHIFERPNRPEIGYAQRDLILLGDGRGRFRELRCPALEERPEVGRGLAAGDFDRDGDPDLAISNNGGPLQLLASDLPGLAGGGLAVRLAGAGANREAVGAVVTLVTSAGRRVRWVTAGDSYQSASDRVVLYAVPAGERVEALEVRWPSGRRRRIEAPPIGTNLTIYE